MKSSNIVLACLVLSSVSSAFAKEAGTVASAETQLREFNQQLRTSEQAKLTAQRVAELPSIEDYLIIYEANEMAFSPSLLKKIETLLTPFLHIYDKRSPGEAKVFVGPSHTRAFIAIDRVKMADAIAQIATLNSTNQDAVFAVRASDVIEGGLDNPEYRATDITKVQALTFTAEQSESVLNKVDKMISPSFRIKTLLNMTPNNFRQLAKNTIAAYDSLYKTTLELNALIQVRTYDVVKLNNPSFSHEQVRAVVNDLLQKDDHPSHLAVALRHIKNRLTPSNNLKTFFDRSPNWKKIFSEQAEAMRTNLDSVTPQFKKVATIPAKQNDQKKITAPGRLGLLKHSLNDEQLSDEVTRLNEQSEQNDLRRIDFASKALPVIETYVVAYKNDGQEWSTTTDIEAALSQLKSTQLENTDPKKITDHVAHTFDFMRNKGPQVKIAASRKEVFVALNPTRIQDAIRAINEIPGVTAYRLSQVIAGVGLDKVRILPNDLTSISYAASTPTQSQNILRSVEALVSQQSNRDTLARLTRHERPVAQANLERAFMPLVTLKKDIKVLISERVENLVSELRPNIDEKEKAEVVEHVLAQSNSGKSLLKAAKNIDSLGRIADNYDAAILGDTTAVDLALSCNNLLID